MDQRIIPNDYFKLKKKNKENYSMMLVNSHEIKTTLVAARFCLYYMNLASL